MAPPIPGLKPPPPAQRRSVGDVAAGLLATVALAVLVVGVPVALITVLGLPIPHSKPTLSLLTHQLSILSLIQILSVIVWLAWLQLVFCVAVEVRAAIRNVGVPARIPLSGGTQAVAHRLVTAALLLFTAAGSLSPAFASTGPAHHLSHSLMAAPQPGPPIQAALAVLTSHETAGLNAAKAAGAAGSSSVSSPDVEKIYIVKPPVGRFHQSLWEIAENHLGNGLRYREIFEMNAGRPQPDGTTLTIASLIRPGWVLRMPRDAYGPGVEIVAPGTPGGPAGAAEQAGASQAQRASDAATGTPGATSGTPGSLAGGQPSQSPPAVQVTPSSPAQHGTPGAQNSPGALGPAAAEHTGASQAQRVTQAETGGGHAAIPGASQSPGTGVTHSPGTGVTHSPGLGANQTPGAMPPHTPGATHGPDAAERTAAGQAGRATQAETGGGHAAIPGATQSPGTGASQSPDIIPPGATQRSDAAAERTAAGQADRATQAATGGQASIPGPTQTPQNTPSSSASPTGASPTGASPTGASPTGASPTGASPTGASPTGASPTGASPTGASPTGPSPTGASPTGSPTAGSPNLGGPAYSALGPTHDQAGGALPAFPHELAASSLLSAGLLAALSKRKREQLWQRAYGMTVPRPEGAAAMAESALRLGANDSAVRLLDVGLRSLSQELAARGKIPPTVFAAHIGQVNLDLWIAGADRNPPRPWVSVDDGQVWRLPLTAVANLDPDDAGAALAPYPGLISIGTSDTGRMLVDLEVAHGLIAVRGPHAMVQAVLAAMAVELATNRWSDRMRITLVGFSRDLAMICPERFMTAESLDEALPALEARAAEIDHALASLQADTLGLGPCLESAESGEESGVLAGRSRGLQPDSWAPHYLISAIPPTPQQRERLLTLATTRHRTAMGYVVAGDAPGATWSWDVNEQGRLHAGVLGFDLRAQLLPAHQYAAVIDLFRTASRTDGVPLPAPPPDAAPPEQLVPGARMAVEVSMLGQVAVQAPGGIEPNRVGAATEIVAFLAAHPEGVHPIVLTHAIWPRGVTDEVREAAFTRVRDWLGTDAVGQPNLVTDAAGLMRLGPQVRVDWQVFRSLVGQSILARQTVAQADRQETAYLARAMDLVQGQLLDGHDPRRYAWLAADPLEYQATAQVADVAHRLCELRLVMGDADGAMDAARSGLRIAFNDELLWRDLLTAAHATGQEHVLRGVVGEMSARVSLDEVLPRMAPETEALIDTLLPSWRSSVA